MWTLDIRTLYTPDASISGRFCPDFEALKSNYLITGHSISGMLQNLDCVNIRTLKIRTFLRLEIEFALTSGVQKPGYSILISI